MDLVVAMQVILDPDQTRVHRAISVGVVIPAVIPVASQVAGITMVVAVAILVMEEVIPVVAMQVIIQEAEEVAIQEAEAEEVAIQEGI